MSITHLCVHKLYKNYQLMAVYNFEILVMIMFILVDARGKRCDLDKKKEVNSCQPFKGSPVCLLTLPTQMISL